MNTISPRPLSSTKSKFINWPPVDALPRDQEQSHLLHEPTFRINTTDPITGGEITDRMHHPSVMDGNLTVYFETDASRQAYQEIPLNHPSLRLPFPATDDDDRGG